LSRASSERVSPDALGYSAGDGDPVRDAQVGDDVVITIDTSNTLTLKNVVLASLHQNDVLIL
jgi:hypothetical protein